MEGVTTLVSALGVSKEEVLVLIKVLKKVVPAEQAHIYNGIVEGVTTLVSALGVSVVGFVKLDWVKYGGLAVVMVSLLEGGLLYWMSQTGDIWVAYLSTHYY